MSLTMRPYFSSVAADQAGKVGRRQKMSGSRLPDTLRFSAKVPPAPEILWSSMRKSRDDRLGASRRGRNRPSQISIS